MTSLRQARLDAGRTKPPLNGEQSGERHRDSPLVYVDATSCDSGAGDFLHSESTQRACWNLPVSAVSCYVAHGTPEDLKE
mmetsp:Transcript_6724/g.13372  ORF Transcript_6724/g.13372 Transcript_6724/m.13372 type:complete len:80 (+) Transcript_6724:1282-1521(+)